MAQIRGTRSRASRVKPPNRRSQPTRSRGPTPSSPSTPARAPLGPASLPVATDRYKLIRYPATDEWELFDLETDPREMLSRAGDPAYAGIRSELEAELGRLRLELEVP